MTEKKPLVYEFSDTKTIPDAFHEYKGKVKENCVLVIDNGSYQFRAGWADDIEPRLVFKNVIARNRGNKKDRDWDILIGNDIPDLEAVRWMIRTAFDFNVVVNFGIQEAVFDHAFTHVGVNTDGKIDHPIVMTEPAVNPPYSRKQMSELLFEAYDVPKLSYGIDSLFSYHYNKKTLSLGDEALILSSGFQSTHVLPVINGSLDVKNCRRINLGGYNNGAYLQRLLQLKYPKLSTAFTLTRMDQFLRDMGEVPLDYFAEISKWIDPDFREENAIIMQIPDKPNLSASQAANPPTNRTIYLGRKLRRMEYKYYDLECILDLEEDNPDVMTKAMSDAGFSDVEDINKKMNKLQTKMDKLHEEITFLSQNNFPLTEIPIHVEKHQGLEILFQPSLVGYEQAGLGEVMETVLSSYPDDIREKMAKNVLITGGNTCYKGFQQRVETELVKCQPFGSATRVLVAQNPNLDAWNGARVWSLDNINQEAFWMNRKDFEEKGWDYLKEHCASNTYSKLEPSTVD